MPVVPDSPTRTRKDPFDRVANRLRIVIERSFSRLKDGRSITIRYDRLARTFRGAVIIASVVAYRS